MTEVSSPSKVRDPFFATVRGSDWNACIGRQGDEENYVDGYMEAAIELVGAVVDRNQPGKSDTLAMPILYNARHALELALKFVIGLLHKAGVVSEVPRKNHDIEAHWKCLDHARIGDSELRMHVADLRRFVDSLHRIDADGQQFRYAETQDGQKSLSGLSICDLEVVRESLVVLRETLKKMKSRTSDFVQEHAVGSFLRDHSRRDLLSIARMLPHRSKWRELEFLSAKEKVMRQFGIGSHKFSEAVNIIKSNREMGGIVGYEFDLAYLTDEHAIFVIDEWWKVHPARRSFDDSLVDLFSPSLGEIGEYIDARAAATKAVIATLSPEEIADLKTVYYAGRERLFCELYERRLGAARKELADPESLVDSVNHLMAKTNLRDAIIYGVESLGRGCLAVDLRARHPDLAHG